MQQQNKYPAITIFYSYAHEDEPFRKQLETHLSLLRRQGLISEWHDREILLGAERAKEIDAHLEAASIILLLISPHFLASNYCYDVELQYALKRHRHNAAQVIPLLISPCDWRTAPFALLQCLPRNGQPVTTWNNQDEAFLEIVQELRYIIEHLTEIPQETHDHLLNQTNHLCCVCHQKGEHIYHIDGDILNTGIGNLAFLCETCFSETEKSKITAPQLRLYMASLYAELKHYDGLHAINSNLKHGPHSIEMLSGNAAIEEIFSLAKEIVRFIHDHRDDFSVLSDDQVRHILDLYRAIAKVERAGSLFIDSISKVIDKLSDVKKARFVKEFSEHIHQFGHALALVNLDLLDIYSPGLAKKIYGLCGLDADLYLNIAIDCGRINPQGNSYQDIILGLFAEHFTGAGYWELERYVWRRQFAANTEDLQSSAVQTSLKAITECKEMLRQLIREHWKLV